MSPVHALAALSLTLCTAIGYVSAAPTLVYDLQAQFPPVARVGERFVFDFLPGTFTTNTTGLVQYSTSTLPSWLAFTSGPPEFYGTPSAGDVGEQSITVTATDSTGSTDATWVVIVSNYSAPQTHAGFTSQIADPSTRSFSSVTAMPSDTGVQVPPYWSFSLGWQWDTFRMARNNSNGNLFTAARLRGTASLPTWLNFDNSSMTFTGVAPADGNYWITVTGTDYWGYTAAQSSFAISVGQGEALELTGSGARTVGEMSGMARNKAEGNVDISNVTIAGQAAQAAQLNMKVAGDFGDWLSIEGTTISGTVPDRYQNGTTNPVSIPITIASTNISNTLTLTAYYDLNILQYPFSSYSLPDIKAAPGDKVDVSLAQYINNATDITISTSSSSQRKRADGDWLSYDSSSQSLTGTVPKNANGDLTATMTATNGGYTGTSDFRINVAPGNTNTSAAPSASSSSGSSNSSGGLSKGAKIGLGVGLGLLGLILLLLLLFCCRRRRQKQQVDNDGDSFVAGPRSPMHNNDPFRKSAQQHRSIFGTMGLPWGKPDNFQPSPQPSMDTSTTVVEKPQRVDGLNGIFAMEKPTKNQSIPNLNNPSTASFLGQGDVIAISTPERTPREGDMSSFTDSFSSGSRASWESEHSFKWSSGENESRQHGENSDARLSLAPSIARPRENFTPRYPRSNSPSRLQHLASGRTLDSPDFSEFGSPKSQSRRRSVTSPGFTASGSMGTGSNGSHSGSGSAPSGATFPSGPSGLDRWSRNESSGTGMVLAEYDEDEHTDHEEPAVVKMAERQSFETRRPSTKRSTGPRLKPSRERMTSSAVAAGQPRHSRQLEQEQAHDEGMFDDAEDEHRRSRLTEASRLTTYAPDPNEDASHGLGYPASAIYFNENKRDSSIRAIDADAHNHPMSPPLPSVGSFVRPRPLSTASADQVDGPSRVSRTSTEVGSPKVPDGRVSAIANETFSIHPQIHPPPTVSLSAATWSSAPPSTYRAELVGGAQLPSWLHFDSRNLELWGVPAMEHSGDVLVLRIVEKMPRDKRFSNPMAFGYQPAPEREVGRMTIEVTDRIKSPQFAFENSPHAL